MRAQTVLSTTATTGGLESEIGERLRQWMASDLALPLRAEAAKSPPQQAGLGASLNRPGGNITGITSMNVGLAAKQLGLCINCCTETRALRS